MDLNTRIYTKWLSFRLKIVEIILSFARFACPHILLRIHSDDNEHFYEVCAFCHKEVDAEIEDE